MRPTVREVSKQYEGRVNFIILAAHSLYGEKRAKELKVHGHPVLIFLDRNGKEVLRRYGLVDKKQIQHGFDLLATAP